MAPIRPSLRTSSAETFSTITQTEAAPPPQHPGIIPSGTLRLRGESANRRRIRWAEDVIDNEGLGRKKSKVCCIYHKSRDVGESSSEDDSDSSSSSDDDNSGDSEQDNSRARMGGRAQKRLQHHHSHDHINGNNDGHGTASPKSKSKRQTSPNAYEKMPKSGGTHVMK
ncbi:hypothetical protein MMC14_004986 [Varicellaria rhodocarpa]|nr:hypothetical protein [Varicellaria rhodocarpa]